LNIIYELTNVPVFIELIMNIYWTYHELYVLKGFNGHLRLLHPAQLVCYAEHGSGRPNRSVRLFMYNCLAFHPQKPTLLFCQWYFIFWWW